jgi:hypothetical protein
VTGGRQLELPDFVLLRRCWLKENRVIHDYDIDYLGKELRRRIFLDQTQRKKLTGRQVAWDKLQHGFPRASPNGTSRVIEEVRRYL